MVEIIRNTLGEAHNAIMRHLLELWKKEDQDELTTEDNEQTIESPGMKVRVLTPWVEPMVSPVLEFGPKAREHYLSEICRITPMTGGKKDFEYTYGNRLFDYPHRIPSGYGQISGMWNGDGDTGAKGINQVARSIIDRLSESPTSRRALAVTWVVEKDIKSATPPCLQLVQFLIRDGCLNMHAVFRSHDMAGGWGPNTFALQRFQNNILEELNIKNPDWSLQHGYLETYSISAHIYVKQDQVKKFRELLRI